VVAKDAVQDRQERLHLGARPGLPEEGHERREASVDPTPHEARRAAHAPVDEPGDAQAGPLHVLDDLGDAVRGLDHEARRTPQVVGQVSPRAAQPARPRPLPSVVIASSRLSGRG
jgi:hypothetical protein